MQEAALLEACDVSVRYGATTALHGVSLDVCAGEVHAVVGENGAGKSTLLRVIAGAIAPSAGVVVLHAEGRWVPQETLLPPDLTVTEWIFLGEEVCGPLGWLRRAAMRTAACAALHGVGADIDPDAALGTLPAPQRKLVQLARALREQPDVLLLDEPTAVLGDRDTGHLFAAIRSLRERGAAVLYVSHRLDEVLAIADRVTVLRDGRWVSTDVVASVDTKTLVHRMVGRDIRVRTRTARVPGGPLLCVTELATAHVRSITLAVHRGEIVGLAGLVGAGRSEILEAIAGMQPLVSGLVACDVSRALVPEDRGRNGLIPALTVRQNVFLPADRAWLRPRDERLALARWMDRLHIRARSTESHIDALSGGNQQKLLLARALRRRPQLLLLDEPTAGVDVGAKAEIHALISELAENGTGILMASSDLPELLLLCDRIVALRGGVAAGELAAAEASEPRLAALITGAEV